tara:strand:+ start:2550 stop:3497 length:948 start_codon:yes stop_codon:yes gene_type:complete
MKRILVTGGAGFIGSNFVRLLVASGRDVIILDKLTYAGTIENLDDVLGSTNTRFVQGDVCDGSVVKDLAKQVDCIVHFAAETHVDRSITDATEFVRTNVQGTHTLLEAARSHDLRFLQIGTDEVYGSTNEGLFTESSELRPSSPYSASKAAADLLVRSYSITYGLDEVITRSSNNYGPFQHPEKFIPRMITNALNDLPLPIYGDGLNSRDWLYVDDNCRGILTVMEKGVRGETYNIGCGQDRSNLEVVKAVLQLLSKPMDLIQYVPDRLGHDRRYALDWARMKSLGWKPLVDFSEGLGLTVEWYVSHPEWWKHSS